MQPQPFNLFEQVKDMNDMRHAPQAFQDRIRHSNVSNGGAMGTVLTSKAGDITINDGEEEEN